MIMISGGAEKLVSWMPLFKLDVAMQLGWVRLAEIKYRLWLAVWLRHNVRIRQEQVNGFTDQSGPSYSRLNAALSFTASALSYAGGWLGSDTQLCVGEWIDSILL